MRYMILVAGDESTARKVGADGSGRGERSERWVGAYEKYTDDLTKAGVLLAGDALRPSATGARITTTDGKRKVTDGPFAGSNEIIGGYYLIQAQSREEALEWAARCPGAQREGRSYVELREIAPARTQP
jgi:hypothetical protein